MLVYLDSSGIADITNFKPRYQFVETADGYHPLKPSAIFWHRKKTLPAICVIFSGNWEPFNYREQYIDGIALAPSEAYSMKLHRLRIRISKIWMRKFVKFGLKFVEFWVLSFWLAFILFAIYIVTVILR